MKYLKAFVGWIVSGLFFAWALVSALMDIVGRSTFGEDLNSLLAAMPEWLQWLFQTPWYVPSGLATILVIVLIYWLLKDESPSSPSFESKAQKNNPRVEEGSIWAKGLKNISIKDAACALAGKGPEGWKEDTQISAIANDILGDVRNGYLPTAEDVADGTKLYAVRAGQPTFSPKKNVTVNVLISASWLREFGKKRGLDVSWID